MVKAAYSSGTPAYGVGPGNPPVVLDRDYDLTDAAQKTALLTQIGSKLDELERAIDEAQTAIDEAAAAAVAH